MPTHSDRTIGGKIVPGRIHVLHEHDLSGSHPAFDAMFPFERISNVRHLLVVDEAVDVVLLRESVAITSCVAPLSVRDRW
jgi:hypothetical protein